MKKTKQIKPKIFEYEGKNPLYIFEAYVINRLGYSTAGFVGEILGLLIGSAIGIGLFLLIF